MFETQLDAYWPAEQIHSPQVGLAFLAALADANVHQSMNLWPLKLQWPPKCHVNCILIYVLFIVTYAKWCIASRTHSYAV